MTFAPFATLARINTPLTYADPAAPYLTRAFINCVESLCGRGALVELYDQWRQQWSLTGLSLWSSALYWLGVTMKMEGEAWPPLVARDERLVVIANHPYGLLDGIAICALAEKIGRPFKILAHSGLMRVPEAIPYFLPIDFNETEEAIRNNVESRRRAVEALEAGETIIIFPAGGVSTAPLKLPLKQFARVDDLPWKNFVYRLIRLGRATVVPLYFVGQNGPLFHAVSRVSMAWRLALLVGALNKQRGKPLHVRVGRPIPWPELAAIPSPGEAMRELRCRVYALGRQGGHNPQGEPPTVRPSLLWLLQAGVSDTIPTIAPRVPGSASMVRIALGQQMLRRPMPERRLDALPDSAAPQLPRLLQFWSDAVRRAGIPSRARLDAFTLRPWLGHISIYEAIDGGRDYRIRLEGTMIVALTGEDWTGRRASDVDRRYGSQLAEFMHDVTETGQPAIHTMRLFQNDVESITRLLLPIRGRPDGPIDQVFLVMYADPKQASA